MSTAVRRALYGKLAGDTTLNNLLGTPATNYSKSRSTTKKRRRARRIRW
jgi:hypothetical protein